MKLNIKLNRISENCFFEGKIYWRNAFLSTTEIIDLFREVSNAEELLRILTNISGFFYLAIETEDNIFLVTDIVRTYPIFYRTENNEISVGNNAFDLTSGEKLSIKDVDGFLTCGYTLGNTTIFQNIFQVESANLLSISKTGGKVETITYYSPVKTSYNDFEKGELFAKLNETYEKVVQKALDYANGRTIVVPLSGGYDSRLIVMTLKRLGAKNVICHAYGTKHLLDIGHLEIQTSKRVAEQLGFQWVFVKYTYSEWNKLIQAQHAENQIKYISKGVSTIAFQDWLAISELKKQNLVPQNSVFIPGHTGDFIAGSAIPLDIDFNKTYGKQQALKTLSKRYFNLFPFVSDDVQLKNCETFVQPSETYSAEEYVRFIETFSWKEFHSKYAAHSAQVYNLYGYDWYFPLWEREIVDLWFSVHPKEKAGRELYKEFTEKYYQSSIPYVFNGLNKNFFLRVLFKLCKVLKFEFLVNNQYGIYTRTKFSLFFKKIPVPNEIKDSFVLKNSSRKLRKISINGFGSLQVLLNNSVA